MVTNQLIRQQADLNVCGESGSAPEALQLMESRRPDIAIVDISLASGSGIELIKNIRSVHPGMALLRAVHALMKCFMPSALCAPARAVTIMKSVEATQKVIQAIRAVLAGEIYVSPKVAALMAQKFIGGKSGNTIEQLSDRELEVFQLLGRGHSTRQIAEHLHIGFKTVQGYTARIKEKLNLANINELMREAIRWHESSEKPDKTL